MLRDSTGNEKYYSAEERLAASNFGVISILDGSVTTTDLSLTASTPGNSVFTSPTPDTSSGTSFSGGVSMSGVTIEGSNVWVTGASTDY